MKAKLIIIVIIVLCVAFPTGAKGCLIGHLTLKNRFVHSATGESRAMPDGILTEEIFPIYESLARGRVGQPMTILGIRANCRAPEEMAAAGAFVAFDAASYISGQTIPYWPTAPRRKEGSPCPSGSLSLRSLLCA